MELKQQNKERSDIESWMNQKKKKRYWELNLWESGECVGERTKREQSRGNLCGGLV